MQPEWRRIGAIDFGQEHPSLRAMVGSGQRREDDPVPRDLPDTDGCWRTWRLSCASSTTRPTRRWACGRRCSSTTTLPACRLKGVPCRAANKSVEPGLKLVNQRLRRAGDGKPRMVLWRTARVHPADPRQVASHKPTCTAEEFAQYTCGTFVRTAGIKRSTTQGAGRRHGLHAGTRRWQQR